ncbi:MAG: tRNA (adenosine(37)-N6)-threonylcarbamoyltransferase complex ATPase subunit type 1 TsaE [Gammaproteobacteria bacterium]|nr:tRNA (adenosine(37)-N6)-threonylcarbamoyltransferase complex ATPase subunit type 1 TsaE [Gammaproteobacteria bacterium]MBU1647120.1 tRNA (adenosine(37)-N6)-threonylcarbamoyltransferase complex ATPase subunit type 1 TsaE [Gammaproteobacteria bacterium]MBU1972632.1 tRNA (adenosine(37)-N6)-threonylcarbamoyltransferase complex ATPase subunit type 1 TsaE [Gammaproteobacteria bacterium]
MHAGHITLDVADESATLALGAALAQVVEPGLVVWLDGDLGTGKTTLVRGLLRALGDTGPVKSPTYTLVEVHPVSGLNLYHFDLYRFNQPEEYLDAGLDEYFDGQGICVVEWPDRAAPYLPAADVAFTLEHAGTGRRVSIMAHGARGEQCLGRLKNSLTNFPFPVAPSSSSPPPP